MPGHCTTKRKRVTGMFPNIFILISGVRKIKLPLPKKKIKSEMFWKTSDIWRSGDTSFGIEYKMTEYARGQESQWLSTLCHLITKFFSMFLIGNSRYGNPYCIFFRKNDNQELVLQHFTGEREPGIPIENGQSIGKWETSLIRKRTGKCNCSW